MCFSRVVAGSGCLILSQGWWQEVVFFGFVFLLKGGCSKAGCCLGPWDLLGSDLPGLDELGSLKP